MKKGVVITISMLLVLGLVACGGSSSSTSQASTASKLSTSYTGALPAVTQLAAGTLSLEGSELAVSAEQAVALLPLWQAYRALSQSDTTAPAELEALTNQILETMTSAQIDAINAMQLKQADLGSLMEKLGLRPVLAAGATPGAQFQRGEGFPQGFAGAPPGGAPGAGGFVFSGGFEGGGGQGLAANPNATPQAARTPRAGGSSRQTLFFIEPLLTMLQARAGGTPQP
ncbi:MAG: hypothetical protein NTY23_03065 [Chloroflexi bacterium]|nr:hypothetical protein [Chloroflexota bacterium]